MKLEVGKYYRTRNGRKVGPMRAPSGPGLDGHFFDPNCGLYTASGSFGYIERDSHLCGAPELDIVAEWNVVAVGDVATNKYKRTVPTTQIDIYDVIVAWDIRCPARQHALKKIMCAGERGAKGVVQDLDEAIQALQRAKELVK